MKKILLLGTGGTIACKRTPDGLKPVITSEEIPFSVVVLGNFRRFLLVIFLFLFLHLDFSFIYSKFSMPFWGFFY